MIYMVMMKLREEGYGGSSEESLSIIDQAVLPSLQMLKDLEKKGKVMGGFFNAQRSGAMMVQAEDDDELDEILVNLPVWGIFDFEVVNLESFQDAMARDEKVAEGLRTASGM